MFLIFVPDPDSVFFGQKLKVETGEDGNGEGLEEEGFGEGPEGGNGGEEGEGYGEGNEGRKGNLEGAGGADGN